MITRILSWFRPVSFAGPFVDLDAHTARCVDAMRLFGGAPSAPLVGETFQEYLDRCGVRHFSAEEIIRIRPEKRELARSLGFENFDPGPHWWPRLTLQALAADRLREHLGTPIVLRNAWRPEAYNDAVGGAGDSAHIDCHAYDLVVQTANDWDEAVLFLLEWYEDRRKCLNLGFGENRESRFIHLGTHDTKDGALSRRRWRYRNRKPVSWHTARLP